MKPFSAPIPSLKSQDLSLLAKGKPLTNRAIKKYILAGRYGEEARLRELAKQKKPKQKSKSSPSPSPKPSIDLSMFLD